MMPYLVKIAVVPALILFAAFTNITPDDAAKMQKISAMEPSLQKIDALHIFKTEYPESQHLNRANQQLFVTYLNIGNPDSALQYAHIYIEALPAPSRMNAYNGVAYSLAEAGFGLDTALIYADRALGMANGNMRYTNIIKDTKAYVLYKNGDSQSALEIQQEAIKGNEYHPEYLYHLALYLEGTGDTEGAIKNAGMAALYGDPGEAVTKINEWGKDVNDEIKSKVIKEVVNDFVDASGPDEKTAVKSGAAAFMAQTGVELSTADRWTEEAVKSITDKTKVEDYVNFKTDFAIVNAALGKYDDALKVLEEIENLAEPWSGKYWLTLGNLYEYSNQKEKALEAYASGLIVFENPPVLEAAKKVASDEEIRAQIEKKKQEVMSFHPGKFDESSKTTDKVVLAELFTGAECGPCAAADLAFDGLAEYYPRNTLAILEYHVHIPGPDPLTNPEGYQRYNFYGADFGTPTVFFEGREKITNGGPKIAALNRFNIYKHAIGKYLNNKPEVKISGNAALEGDIVDINLTIKPDGETDNIIKPVLFIALTEKSVKYTGANGIDKHIFVVRDIVDEPAGTEISLKSETSLKKSVDIKKLEGIITNYLTDPTKDPSWKAPQFSGWRLKIDELNNIDENNLAVVAWIQDAKTKEVLQAHYFDVK
ncbi:MAG: hypothetical protein R6W90_12095 [Ignavibacteriaceae bacterium]